MRERENTRQARPLSPLFVCGNMFVCGHTHTHSLGVEGLVREHILECGKRTHSRTHTHSLGVEGFHGASGTALLTRVCVCVVCVCVCVCIRFL